MLRIGAVVFGDPNRQREGRRVDELSVGAHIAYTAEEPELIAELVYVRHDAAALPDGTGAGSFEHWSWYVQAAWRLPGAWSDLKPYLRYERLLLDEAEDPTLANASGIEVMLGGVRWDVTPWLALKLETSWRKRDGAESLLETIIQASSAW